MLLTQLKSSLLKLNFKFSYDYLFESYIKLLDDSILRNLKRQEQKELY